MNAMERMGTPRPPEGLTEEYLWQKYGSDITTWPLLFDDCKQFLQFNLKPEDTAHWTEGERKMVDLAMRVALESFEYKVLYTDKTRRFDKSSWMLHVLQVASMCNARGMDARVFAIALLHDTIEDTQELKRKYPDDPRVYQITEDDLHRIFKQFDTRIAGSVTRLTKLKSHYLERVKNISTHRLLYDLLKYDPEAIVVKLFDRVHYMQTARVMDTEKRRAKAKETMQYYVPLATGLGLHDIATILGDYCAEYLKKGESLAWPHTREQYEESMDIVSGAIHQWDEYWKKRDKQTGIVEYQGQKQIVQRRPFLGEAFRFTHGRIDKLQQAWIPGFITVVMKNIDDVSSTHIHPSFVHIAAPLMYHLYESNIITLEQLNEFNEQIAKGAQRTMHIDIPVNGVPIRLRFALEEEEIKWQASIVDYSDKGSKRGDAFFYAALEKIDALEHMYEFYVDRELSSRALMENLNECLIRGATTVRILTDDKSETVAKTDDRAHVFYLPANSTVLDMALAYTNDEDDMKIVRIFKETPAGLQSVQSFDEKVEKDGLYKIELADEPIFDVTRFGKVRTKYGESQLQKSFRMELRRQLNVGETKLADELIKRGERVLQSLFLVHAKTLGSKERLQASIAVAQKSFGNIRSPYSLEGKRIGSLQNMLLRIGLGEIPIDNGRTSVAWNIVRAVYAFQTSRKFIGITVPDTPGQLNTITRILDSLHVNIDAVDTPPDYTLRAKRQTVRGPKMTTVRVWLSANEFSAFEKKQGLDKLRQRLNAEEISTG